MISTILMDSLWTSGWTPNRTSRQNQAGCPIADQLAARRVTREQRLPTMPPIGPCALRGIALGRKSWLFAGSDRGGARAAAMYSLIVTAKLN